jgi:hypothetical protein
MCQRDSPPPPQGSKGEPHLTSVSLSLETKDLWIRNLTNILPETKYYYKL